MKIIHMIDRLPPDGAERLLVDVLKNRQTDWDYQVVCLVSGGLLVQELTDMDVPVKIFAKKRGIDLRLLWQLTQYLRQQKPDVVHTHLFTADSWGRLAAYFAGVPLIFATVHSINSWKKPLHHRIDRCLSRISQQVIACSPVVATSLKTVSHIAADKITTISNGIDLSRFQNCQAIDLQKTFGISPDTVTLAVIGRLHPAKGQQDVLPLMQTYLNMGLKVHLLLVGEGELKNEIEAEIQQRDLAQVVTLTGQRQDIPELLASIDILVMPSRWEGLPMVLLEAMLMQKAVIAYGVGGIPDVIRNDENGLLIKAKQRFELEKQLHRLIMDADLRQRLGQAAQQTVEQHYNAKLVAKRYEKRYVTGG